MIKDSGQRTEEPHKRLHRWWHPGDRVGELTLIERSEVSRLWIAECSCGERVVFQPSSNQQTCRKCASKRNGERMRIHGESPDTGKNASRLYRIWLGMKTRCNNPNAANYERYGGRGITVCEEWNDYLCFKAWAMGNGYEEHLSIDRIDVNGNYTPENCRWATNKTQGNNRSDNHMLTFNGITATLMEWSEMTGIKYHTLKRRINAYGFSVEEALTRPVGKSRNSISRKKMEEH